MDKKIKRAPKFRDGQTDVKRVAVLFPTCHVELASALFMLNRVGISLLPSKALHGVPPFGDPEKLVSLQILYINIVMYALSSL
jgi:hypothetical protein